MGASSSIIFGYSSSSFIDLVSSWFSSYSYSYYYSDSLGDSIYSSYSSTILLILGGILSSLLLISLSIRVLFSPSSFIITFVKISFYSEGSDYGLEEYCDKFDLYPLFSPIVRSIALSSSKIRPSLTELYIDD